MCKAMKRITRVALFVLVLSVLMTTALAEHEALWLQLEHFKCGSVLAGTYLDGKDDKQQILYYHKSKYRQCRGRSTYYKVALSSGGSASARVRCNVGRLQERAISGIYTINRSMAPMRGAMDSTLNTEVVDGLTYIYNR